MSNFQLSENFSEPVYLLAAKHLANQAYYFATFDQNPDHVLRPLRALAWLAVRAEASQPASFWSLLKTFAAPYFGSTGAPDLRLMDAVTRSANLIVEARLESKALTVVMAEGFDEWFFEEQVPALLAEFNWMAGDDHQHSPLSQILARLMNDVAVRHHRLGQGFELL